MELRYTEEQWREFDRVSALSASAERRAEAAERRADLAEMKVRVLQEAIAGRAVIA